MENKSNIKPLRNAGILLGIGMGGFVDGILFHQIFQIHNMLSNRYFPDTLANEQLNMFWDGMFHVFTWMATAFGIASLWKAAKRNDVPLLKNTFLGSMILGWGLFNFIEGLIDHQILQLHHVVQRASGLEQLLWDLAYLASGLIFMGIGLWLIRKDSLSVHPVEKPLKSLTLTHT